MKLTFARGAALADPSGLFNSSLEGNVRRALDIHEGDKINEKALKALIRAAVALNTATRAAKKKTRVSRLTSIWDRTKQLQELQRLDLRPYEAPLRNRTGAAS